MGIHRHPFENFEITEGFVQIIYLNSAGRHTGSPNSAGLENDFFKLKTLQRDLPYQLDDLCIEADATQVRMHKVLHMRTQKQERFIFDWIR